MDNQVLLLMAVSLSECPNSSIMKKHIQGQRWQKDLIFKEYLKFKALKCSIFKLRTVTIIYFFRLKIVRWGHSKKREQGHKPIRWRRNHFYEVMFYEEGHP